MPRTIAIPVSLPWPWPGSANYPPSLFSFEPRILHSSLCFHSPFLFFVLSLTKTQTHSSSSTCARGRTLQTWRKEANLANLSELSCELPIIDAIAISPPHSDSPGCYSASLRSHYCPSISFNSSNTTIKIVRKYTDNDEHPLAGRRRHGGGSQLPEINYKKKLCKNTRHMKQAPRPSILSSIQTPHQSKSALILPSL